MERVKLLIGVAGPMGSGKSSIARALAEAAGGAHLSFGDAVRKEALRRGLGSDRDDLQNLGDQLIDEGWPEFVNLVLGTLEAEPDVVVVDGIRHPEAHAQLERSSAGRNVVLVYVETDTAIRVARVMDRDRRSIAEVAAEMAHPNERQVEGLRQAASVILDNNRFVDIGDALRRIHASVRK